MAKRITIDPITRLEGHGKIEIFLDDAGNVANAYLQIPELRGFEKFAEGRLVEDMPRITPKICGVCPTAHHMASGKTVDAVYHVDPPPAAKKIRELINSAFAAEDHTLHFYFLGGPDFVVGPEAPAAERNILGVIGKVGVEAATKVIGIRRRLRAIITALGGRVIHPVCNVPGGVSKGVTREMREEFIAAAEDAVEFAKFTLGVFGKIVLANKSYVDLVVGDIYLHRTYYMGLVDAKNRLNLYDGMIRVVTPSGKEFAKFPPSEYVEHIAEHVEPWSYIKFPYLKKVGWKGFTDGEGSGVYRVAPLARLNAAEGMATPAAQEEYERMYATLGGKPAHNTLAYHWARLVELLYAAERLRELARDEEILDPHIRTLPTATPTEGVGVVEAPRGTLYHHYKTDERGVVTEANLIVATVNNSAAISMSIARAARKLIKNGEVRDGLLNMVEMAFRAYDPCFACATHAAGQAPLLVTVRDARGAPLRVLRRD
ncbi:MAG TPA: Ni/Fe hydrogenase subunit alpha [Planctomycetes bacterium]|nr:Ni/Fe hydrogenase subunit alpha [Planctomycetota bacterium]